MSRSRRTKSDIKKLDKLVVRDPTTKHVKNVIFPHGIVIGLASGKDNQAPFLVRGNATIEGDVVIKGNISQTATAPFLYLDVSSNVFAFDNRADETASPPTIILTAQQVSQSSTLVQSLDHD